MNNRETFWGKQYFVLKLCDRLRSVVDVCLFDEDSDIIAISDTSRGSLHIIAREKKQALQRKSCHVRVFAPVVC